MIFKCLDGPFGSVDAVVVGLDQLEANLCFFEVLFDCLRCNVVDDVEFRFETTLGKVFHLRFKCANQFSSFASFMDRARMALLVQS